MRTFVRGALWRRFAASTVLLGVAATARAQQPVYTNEKISVASSGVAGDADSRGGSISIDGRFVAFASTATNLVPDDTNGRVDVYLRDRLTGTTTRVSRSVSGGDPDADCLNPSMSDDGRYIAFDSQATNLVEIDDNPKGDVFVFDRVTGATKRVSFAANGVQANNWCYGASISGNGKFVAFVSRADNMGHGDLNGSGADVYVRDLVQNTTQRVSVNANGVGGNFPSEHAAISGDGRYVAFDSVATNLVSGPPPSVGPTRVYARDRQLNTTQLISKTSGGAVPNASAWRSAISRNGLAIAYESAASDLISGDTNEQSDVFLWDRNTGQTELVSRRSSGAIALNGPSGGACLSADGLFVAFWSYSDTLVAQDENSASDVFLRDRPHGSTERVSLAPEYAEATGASLLLSHLSVVNNNLQLLYESMSSDIVAGDDDATWDLYVRDGVNGETSSYCFGTSADCPCSNGTEQGGGCGNSFHDDGARLSMSGLPALLVDTVTLHVDRAPTFAAVLFFQGDGSINKGFGTPFGDGLQCVTGLLRRLGLRTASQGVASLGFTPGDLPISVLGNVIQVDLTFHYQAMYRDVADHCSPSTINYTNAITLTWRP